MTDVLDLLPITTPEAAEAVALARANGYEPFGVVKTETYWRVYAWPVGKKDD
jgi:hypothetical protein